MMRQEDSELSFWRLLADRFTPNTCFTADSAPLLWLGADPMTGAWLRSLLRLTAGWCCSWTWPTPWFKFRFRLRLVSTLAGVGPAAGLPLARPGRLATPSWLFKVGLLAADG